jgi:hypothetical protein
MPRKRILKGHDVDSLGPSDSSDSGSDVKGPGQPRREDDSDRSGTGERASVGGNPRRFDRDRDADRVVGPQEAGLGGGLDQAEEARLGVTDEELTQEESEGNVKRRPPPK